MFVGVHAMLAQATGAPEFEISPDEGKMFMASCQNVMRHYSVQTTQKTLDWIALMGTSGAIYGPRLVAMRMRKAQTSTAKPQPQKPNEPGWQPTSIIMPMSDHYEEPIN